MVGAAAVTAHLPPAACFDDARFDSPERRVKGAPCYRPVGQCRNSTLCRVSPPLRVSPPWWSRSVAYSCFPVRYALLSSFWAKALSLPALGVVSGVGRISTTVLEEGLLVAGMSTMGMGCNAPCRFIGTGRVVFSVGVTTPNSVLGVFWGVSILSFIGVAFNGESLPLRRGGSRRRDTGVGGTIISLWSSSSSDSETEEEEAETDDSVVDTESSGN